jgi:cell division GTPase FtsZ
MRILAIGLGGAGCRIVNSLYATDRRSSKVACVQALVIDVNSDTLAQLGSIPDDAKLYFPPFDPDLHPEEYRDTQTATIDIGEIVSRVQNFESGETDAIFVCCGLGGSMVDVAPHIIASLRSSTAEPIFGLVTLPCLAEGERHSAKAADDIEMLSPLLDGIILFDNETWYKKTKAARSTLVKKEKGLAEKLGFRKNVPEVSPELATYLLLNEAVVRRISLILRAGEFKADGGLDLAEVVLDSGEVLNTMKGMGFITIGYAVERLPHHPLSFLTSWHPTGLFPDAHKIKASRIVDLAKQAIYHEISTPCDMTSAHKALILIAGPSHELSMKGFMTVRKWIDRSIAGLETRSGDYPVMNTKNVAIIIMLSGLENIPRITELKEIQNQFKSTHQESLSLSKQSGSEIIPASERASVMSEESDISAPWHEKILKDEMLVLPYKSQKAPDILDSGKFNHVEEHSHADRQETPRSIAQHDILPGKSSTVEIHTGDKTTHYLTPKSPLAKDTGQSVSSGYDKMKTDRSHEIRPRLHMPVQADLSNEDSPKRSSPVSSAHVIAQNQKSISSADSKDSKLSHTGDERLKTKEMERQIIERELQRQRTIAISGHKPKTGTGSQTNQRHPTEIVRIKREISKKIPLEEVPERPDIAEISSLPQERRTVIIQKKRVKSDLLGSRIQPQENQDISGKNEDSSAITHDEMHSEKSDSERMKAERKDSAHTSKNHIFGGKDIKGSASPQVRDSALIHTTLKSKKKSMETKDEDVSEGIDLKTEVFKSPDKREKTTSKKDDISWI